jgi:anti-sigma-K factor RskA
MVEAVEPPAEILDKIKSSIGAVAQSGAADFLPLAPTLPPIAMSADAESKAETDVNAGNDTESSGGPAASDVSPEAEALGEAEPDSVSVFGQELAPKSESEPKPESGAEPRAASPTPAELLLSPSPLVPRQAARSADVLVLTRRVRRWRGLAVGCGAIAAALAALVVVSQVRPGLIPGGFHVPQLIAQSSPPSPPPAAAPAGGQLIAVLQQDPSAPAFLLTIDPAAQKMTVRTVAAKADANHSFELWLIGSQASKPLSLGLIGGDEYTALPLPAGFDTAAIAAATYAVSFEPAGGSKTGAPTGPILFTGKLVESLPPPSPPKT